MEHISREVKVYWPQEKEWYRGVIDDYDAERGHHVLYDDGDDDWLLDLYDKGVQFVDEEGGGGDYEAEEIDETGKEEDGSDEEQQRQYQSPGRGNNNFLEEKSEEDLPFESSEFSSQELNENTILLKGEITGASNLPFQDTDENDGVFYRVLYVEGGSQSSMFRCKTPIYKSECSDDLEFPRWDEGLFRFEMVLPGDTPAMDFSNLGEVIVALYKSRHNGGSDFVGQISLGIQDFIRIGTVVRARPDCECRSLRGSYVLVDRKGGIMRGGADVDINLRLEWKKQKRAAPVEMPLKPSSAQRMSSNASVGGSTRRSTSSGRPRSASSVASGRSTSTGRNGQNPHTYRRERQLNQVAKENEAMRQRLEKLGPKSVHGTDRVGVIREAYRAPTAAPTNAASDQKRRAESKPRGQAVPSSSSSAGDQESRAPSISISSASLAKRSYSDLVSLFEDLRGRVAKAQKDLQNQRLATNKLKAQAEKHESLVERMKKTEIQSRKGTSAGGLVSARGTPREGARAGVEAVTVKDPDEVAREECSYTIEDILVRNGLPGNEDEISDQVLRELVAEHSALQLNRISLLQRLRGSHEKAEEAMKESSQLKQEIDEVSSILRQSVQRVPGSSAHWNLHQQHRPNKLQAAKAELQAAKDAKKLATICGVVHDDIANMITQISAIDELIEKNKVVVEKVQYDADNWKAKLEDLQEEGLSMKMKTSISLMRGAIYRLRRQERLSEIKSETDAVEMELLRHNLNHQMLLSSTATAHAHAAAAR